MSIWIMSIGDLAKRHKVPATQFMEKLRELGVEKATHHKVMLTQEDLDNIHKLLNPPPTVDSPASPDAKAATTKSVKDVVNPNVIVIRLPDGNKHLVCAIDVSLNEDGTLTTEIIESREASTKARALFYTDKYKGKYKMDKLYTPKKEKE